GQAGGPGVDRVRAAWWRGDEHRTAAALGRPRRRACAVRGHRAAASDRSREAALSALTVLFTGRLEAAEREAWWRSLRVAAPEFDWLRDDQGGIARSRIDVAVVANPAPQALTGLPRLRLIHGLWAGVDKLLADASLPADVPLARMVDPAMNAAMA